MKTRIAALLLLSGCLTGCVKDQNPNHQVEANASNTTIAPEPKLTANTRFAAGQIAESEHDPVRAATQYEEAARIDPKATNALLRLGIIYTQSQQWDQAVGAWNRYIKATNGAAAGYSDLGYTLEMAGRLGDAENAFKTGIASEPRNESCRVNYGLMLARQGRIAEATTQMQVVLSSAQTHYNIASVLESQGKKPAARAEFQQAIVADPDMTDAKERLTALDTH
jgi:tetratricopeptide (TPR) repeat protein